MPGDVPWIIPREKLDEKECVFVNVAPEFEIEPNVIEFHIFYSVMQGIPLNIAH
jgi:hypothetical protein